MPDCTYDDKTHTYRIDGLEVPSVTQVLKEAGIIDDRWYTPEACQRGRLVAVATELWDKGKLDIEKVPEDICGYVEAWIAFKGDSGIIIREIEQPHYSEIYRYAGTPDREMLWSGRPTIIDIKTGGRPPWHALQLAGYDCLFDVPHDRVSVLLKPNGKYSVKTYTDPSDRDAWRGILAKVNWQRSHK